MSEALDDVKRRLSRKFLGKAGIHAVGVGRSQNAIRLYVAPGHHPDQDAVLKEIEQEAAPFPVLMQQEEPPAII